MKSRSFPVVTSLLLFIFSFLSFTASAQYPHDYKWQVGFGSSVGATALKGDTLIVGGEFDFIGPYTGSMVSVELTTGNVQPSFPVVNGPVRSLIQDGSGGYFIGGSFTLVNGYARKGLAHILNNKKLDLGWNINVDDGGSVYALLLSNTRDTLWVAGNFTTIGGLAMDKVAAIKVSSKSVIAGWGAGTFFNNNWWMAPPLRPVICALAYYPGTLTDPAKLLVGGDFSAVSWNTKGSLAALNPTSGTLINNWRADLTECNSATTYQPVGPVVRTLMVKGTTLFIGGLFTQIKDNTGSYAKHSIAATNIIGDGAVVKTFTANILPQNDSGFVNCIKNIRLESGLFTVPAIAGKFQSVNGQNVQNFTIVTDNGDLYPYKTSGGVYANGKVVDTTYTPGKYASGEICTFDTIGTVAVLAGNFEGIQSSGSVVQIRRNLAALDMLDNSIKSWAPVMQTDMAIRAIKISGNELYTAGSFTSAGGAYRRNLAAVSVTTKKIFDFNPQPDSYVNDLEFSPTKDTLYFAGNFANVGATTRGYIAAYNFKTNVLMPWNNTPGAGGGVEDIALDPVRKILYAGGKFTSMQGTARSNLAAINTSTGNLISTWIADVPALNGQLTPVRALVLSPGGDTLFVGGRFDKIAGVTRANIAAILNKVIPLTTATVIPGWDFPVTPATTTDIGVLSFLLDEGRLFVGGKYDAINGNSTLKNLSSINVGSFPNSLVTGWDARIRDGGGGVWCIQKKGSALYLGGDFGTTQGIKTSFASAVSITDASIISAWKPYPTIQPFGGVVLTLMVRDPLIFIGGSQEAMTESINDAVFHLATTTIVDGVLAQSLVSLSVKKFNSGSMVQWSVPETNRNVELERSVDGAAFVSLGVFQNGMNTYKDLSLEAGHTYYYRLLIRTANGEINYSFIRKIAINGTRSNSLQVFVTGGNVLRVINNGGDSFLEVFDRNAQCVVKQVVKNGTSEIFMGKYAKGIYLYRCGKNEDGSGDTGKVFIQ